MSKDELLAILKICNADYKFIEAIELAFDLVTDDRQWQTLSDEEYVDILEKTRGCGHIAFYNMVDKALKEKNT